MTPALRCACACALSLLCLAVLRLQPEGALAEELQLQQARLPRAARWLTTSGQFNKYIEKPFNSSLKPKDTKKSKGVKNAKKTANITKPPPANTTNRPPQDPTNPAA